MGKQVSSIERLPDDVLDRLQELLRDKRVTQLDVVAQINELLAKAGYGERISKSSLNRYAVRMEQVGAKLRESRQIADMWVARLGSTPDGQLGKLLNETVRAHAFDLAIRLDNLDELEAAEIPDIVKVLKDLALTQQRLEASASMNVKREAAVRKQALEDAANAVEEAAVQKGMNAEDAAFWRLKVLGVQ
jgi:hypothetical protein